MKVAKWKVLTIAGAFVLGYAVSSQAVQLKAGEKVLNMDFGTKIGFFHEDNGDTNKIDVKDARLTVDGELNKLVEFYGELVIEDAVSNPGVNLDEAGINLNFMPEAQVRIGKIRVPFTRSQEIDDYAYINQLGHWYDPAGILTSDNAATTGPLGALSDVKGGAVLHGVVANKIVRYSVGLFDTTNRSNQYKSFMFAGRVEISLPIAGFNAEPVNHIDGTVKETYFGKKGDILTIGLGYYSETNADKGQSILGFANTAPSDLKTKGYTMDIFLEKKINYNIPYLKDSVLDFETGYIKLKDSHFYNTATPKKGDTTIYYGQGQILYSQSIGIGMPALYVRYENMKADNNYKLNTLGLGINYYINGESARISAGIENTKYKDAAASFVLDDSLTDYFVEAQIMF